MKPSGVETVEPATALSILRQGAPLENVQVCESLTLLGLASPNKYDVASPIVIRNSSFGDLDCGYLSFASPIVLENVTVDGRFFLQASFFEAGFSAVRCHFKGEVDISCGGHNKNGTLFRLDHCVFEKFASFIDEWFMGPVAIRGCTFRGGSNLLGMKEEPYRVRFDVEPIIEGNTGTLDLDERSASGA